MVFDCGDKGLVGRALALRRSGNLPYALKAAAGSAAPAKRAEPGAAGLSPSGNGKAWFGHSPGAIRSLTGS
jgi:hypothetical protein